MKSLLVYPFCRNFSEFARCAEVLKDYEEVIPIAPKGFGMDGEDACVCDGGDILNIKIISDFEGRIEKADAAFFGYTDSALTVQNYRDKIIKAIDLNKKVYITKELIDFIGDADKWHQAEVIEYTNKTFEYGLVKKMLPIPVPVIIIAGIGDFCDKLSIQLKLNNFISEQGYRVLSFGSKTISKFFGIESLPRFIFDPMDNALKIRKFNAYIYNRVKEENPDVVIIGIPGGIMPINPFEFGEFGEMAFIISNAVKADISILSLYKQEYSGEFIDQFINICKYKYNFHVNYINIANTDLYISADEKECLYTTVSSDYIINSIISNAKNDNVLLFNALHDQSMNLMCSRVLDELQNNI